MLVKSVDLLLIKVANSPEAVADPDSIHGLKRYAFCIDQRFNGTPY